jgi:hypothetical protein
MANRDYDETVIKELRSARVPVLKGTKPIIGALAFRNGAMVIFLLGGLGGCWNVLVSRRLRASRALNEFNRRYMKRARMDCHACGMDEVPREGVDRWHVDDPGALRALVRLLRALLGETKRAPSAQKILKREPLRSMNGNWVTVALRP